MLYGVYLYFCSRSLRLASRTLEPIIDRSHVSLWRWIQRLSSYAYRFVTERRSVRCVFVDETLIRVKGREY
jgi:transposase-like protein